MSLLRSRTTSKKSNNARMDVKSPYFQQSQQHATTARTTSSYYFVQSPSSAYGAVESMGSWLACLAINYCSNDDDDPAACSSSSSIEEEACRPFQTCRYFQQAWDDESSAKNDAMTELLKSGTDDDDNDARAVARMHRCVRHLCAQRCYMRAYAPCREWYALRQKLRNERRGSVNRALRGWCCRLLPADDEYLPRVAFFDADGNMYSSQNQVLRHLLDDSSCVLTERSVEPSDRISGRTRRKRLYPAPSKGRQPNGEDDTLTRSEILPRQFTCTSSPFGLLEELFVQNPWQLLISTILLNRTTRVQVDRVLYEFIQQWPGPRDVERQEDADAIRQVIQPLGMGNRRAAGLIRFSREYLDLVSRKVEVSDGAMNEDEVARCFSQDEILNLYYCGEYACAAYKLFIQKDMSIEPSDEALRAYAHYKRGIPSGSIHIH